MELPDKNIIETELIPMLKEHFKDIKLTFIDDMEFSYYEIVYNDEHDGIITIDNEALEISLDYAFFRFVYAHEDLIAYKVIATGYKEKGLKALFKDAIAFMEENLINSTLELHYTLSGKRLIKYDMYKLQDNKKELLYSYKYTALPDLFFKAEVKMRQIKL